MNGPRFSVVVSTYNRAEIVERCIDSVLVSDFPDFELIVVDDGSSDGTVQKLAAHYRDPRLTVIALSDNQGMSGARRVGAQAARGEWIVVLDSDWELEPFALSRMKAATELVPPEVRVVCFRIRWSDGFVSPPTIPSGITGYGDKLAWWESVKSPDVVRCVQRAVFEHTAYEADRRGAMDTLYELELGQREMAIFSEQVLAVEHVDAPNSWLRDTERRRLFQRLRAEAADMLWMSEAAIERHGEAMKRFAPGLRQSLLRSSALQAFILRRRARGVRHTLAALRSRPFDLSLWGLLVAGLSGRRVVLWGVLVQRRQAVRGQLSSREDSTVAPRAPTAGLPVDGLADRLVSGPKVAQRRGLLAHLSVPLYLNAYLLMISSGLQSALGLPFWALAARLYPAHTVGTSTTVISAAALITSVGLLGLSSVIVRYLPVAHSQSRRFVLVCYGASVGVCLLLSLVAVFTVDWWSPPLHFLKDNIGWLVLFVLASTTGVIFQLEDAVLVGLRETRWVPVENGIFAVSRLALVVVLAHVLTGSGIVLGSAGPGILLPIVVNAGIFLVFLPRRQRTAAGKKPEWRREEIRKLIVGNYLGSMAEFGSLALLPVLITDRAGASSEAYFYIPLSLMLGLTVLAANMSSSLSVETAAGEDLKPKVLASLKVIGAIVVSAAVVVSLIAHPLLLVFGSSYAKHGVWALRWMMLATIPLGVGSVGLAVARIHHNGRLIATAQIVGAVGLILMTLLLLPDYGIAGVGLAALLSAMLSMGVVAPVLFAALTS